MGSVEARILKECYLWHTPVPERIQNAPDLDMGLELYFQAFVELNTCRSVGWAPGPIPWSCVQEYADTFEFDEEQTEDLHYHIRKMDQVFLKRHEDKIKK